MSNVEQHGMVKRCHCCQHGDDGEKLTHVPEYKYSQRKPPHHFTLPTAAQTQQATSVFAAGSTKLVLLEAFELAEIHNTQSRAEPVLS